jgi:hypothetical protein
MAMLHEPDEVQRLQVNIHLDDLLQTTQHRFSQIEFFTVLRIKISSLSQIDLLLGVDGPEDTLKVVSVDDLGRWVGDGYLLESAYALRHFLDRFQVLLRYGLLQQDELEFQLYSLRWH